MSLIVSDRASEKQLETLKRLEYYGDLNLSIDQAAQLIDELFEQQRMDRITSEEIEYGGEKTDIY